MIPSLRVLSSLSFAVFALATAGCAADTTDGSAEDPGGAAAAIVGTSAPSVLFSCTDNEDATAKALLTVDSAARITWNLGQGDGRATTGLLVSVIAPSQNAIGYSLHDTSGYYLDLNLRDSVVSESGLEVDCDPTTIKLDQALLDKLAAATDASLAHKQTYAVCPLAPPAIDPTGPDSVIVRPALLGAGAILEGDDSDGDSWVLFATSTRTSGTKVSYAGSGGLTEFAAGQHVKSFSALSSQATTGGSTLGWDIQDKPLRPEGPCQVTGDAYAKSLINGTRAH